MLNLNSKKTLKFKNRIIGLILFFSFIIINSTIQAQQTIPSTGGNANGIGGSVSYTVGQVVYSTNMGTNGSVAEGVQQPYEISVVIGLDQYKDINLICKVFPNPTKEFLRLKIENYKTDNLSYHLYNINGKLLNSKKATSSESTISVANLPSGTYFLKVVSDNKEIKTFKIIKNH